MIANDLIEAYIGYHELDEPMYSTDMPQFTFIQHPVVYLTGEQQSTVAAYLWLHDNPKQRLEIYCHWNGIIGFSTRLYEIATDTTGPVDDRFEKQYEQWRHSR